MDEEGGKELVVTVGAAPKKEGVEGAEEVEEDEEKNDGGAAVV